MTEIYYATSNSGKFDEVARYCKQHVSQFMLRQFDHDMPELQSRNQQIIAINKAELAWNVLQKPVLVDDSGIYFDRYDQFPGTLTKYIYQGIGFEGLLKLVNPGDKASFLLTMVYIEGPGQFQLFEGRCEGQIIHPTNFNTEPALPFDAIFVPANETRTYAELRHTADESRFSYRIRALQKFLAWYQARKV
jgi:non-canonical purine NTP pyrophosphatase (RdgB/HAM1 family)